MHRFIAAGLFLLALNASAKVLTKGEVTLYLRDSPCDKTQILAMLEDKFHAQFHAGVVRAGAQVAQLCWTDKGPDGAPIDGGIFVIDAYGSSGFVSLDGFTSDNGT